MKTIKAFNLTVNKHFSLYIILCTAIGLIFPEIFSRAAGWKLGMIGQGSTTFSFTLSAMSVMFIMFNAGTSVDVGSIVDMFRKPRDLIVAIIAKFVLMSVISLLVARVFGLNNELTFGLVLLGAMPGGTSSAVLLPIARAELTFGIVLVSVCTILSPAISPLLTKLLCGAAININFASMVLSIVFLVLIPVVLGILARTLLGNAISAVKPFMSLIVFIGIFLILAISAAPNKAVMLSPASLWVIAAITVVFVLSALSYSGVGRILKMKPERRRAFIIASSEQNNALSLGIASGISAVYPSAVIAPIIAVVLNVALAAVLADLLSKRSK